MDTDAFDRRQVARAFGAVLKSARTRKGLSQNALCDAANMDYTYPSLLERGLRTPSLSVVIEIGRALGIEPAPLDCRKPLGFVVRSQSSFSPASLIVRAIFY